MGFSFTNYCKEVSMTDFGSDYEKCLWAAGKMTGNPYVLEELSNVRNEKRKHIEETRSL